MLYNLVRKNRSYRRFDEAKKINRGTLRGLINLARLCPSGANKQPLKYAVSNDKSKNSMIFQALAWAGFLKDWDGPEEGERPSAYIIILGDTAVSQSFDYDAGICAQTILLGAAERGLGGCMIGSVNRSKLRGLVKIPERFKILLVIALGKPAERVVIEEADECADTRYWRDKDLTHHVPKRKIRDIILPI